MGRMKSPMHATCPHNLIHLDLIVPIILHFKVYFPQDPYKRDMEMIRSVVWPSIQRYTKHFVTHQRICICNK